MRFPGICLVKQTEQKFRRFESVLKKTSDCNSRVIKTALFTWYDVKVTFYDLIKYQLAACVCIFRNKTIEKWNYFIHPEGVAPVDCIWRASSKGMPRHAYGRWALINSWRCYWFHYIHVIVESQGVKKTLHEMNKLHTDSFCTGSWFFSHKYRLVIYCCIIQESRAKLD